MKKPNNYSLRVSMLDAIRGTTFQIPVLKLFLLLVGCIWSGFVSGQSLQIKGTVLDENGEGLPGVNVLVEETATGTVTDINGAYKIEVPSAETVLVFSFVGYVTEEVKVGNQTVINLELLPDISTLEDIVVVGYGEQSRRRITSAVSKVNGEAIQEIPVSDVGSAIKGKVAGVVVNNQNFAPGSTPNIRIRGGSSINYSNDPLVIVDGIPRTLSDINPNDIESMEILKDAAASAVYGARASNGVILITTKTGKLNEGPQIEFQSDLSFQQHFDGYPLVNGEEFINLVRSNIVGSPFEYTIYQDGPASHVNGAESVFTPRWLEDGEVVPAGWQSMSDPLFPEKTIIYQENDPVDLLFKPGLWQNYHLSARGGTENIRYAGSIGYTSDNGTVEETDWKRLSAMSNVDIDLTKKLTFSSSIYYTYTNSATEPAWQNAVGRQLIMAPTWRIRYDDGSLVPGFNSSATPPPFWRETRDYDQYQNRLTLNGSLIFEPIEGLTLRGNASYFRNDFEDEYFQKSNYFAQNRYAYTNQNVEQTRQLEGIASYTTTLGDMHDLSFMVGVSDLFIANRELSLAADGGATDIIPTLNAAPNKIDASSYKTEESLIGMFARVGYVFGDKYLLEGSIRRDGSSKFGSSRKWGYFPAVSGGWIVSEEPFMKRLNAVSFLKLRSSYGYTGNNAVGLYAAQGAYSAVRYGNTAGVYATAMPNQNLGWEKTRQFDVGFDLGLFDQRVSVLFDYYSKITEDLLFSSPLPNTSGFSSIITNIGSVNFYGIDLSLEANVISAGNFNWDTRFIYTLSKNEVLKLPDNDRDKNRIGGYSVPNGEDFGGIAEGEPLYNIIGYKVDYIIDNQQQAENAHYDELARGISMEDGTEVKGRKFPGDYEWVDRNGDDIINEYDQFVLGNTRPHTTGGFGNTFSWKGLTLDVYFDYAIGHSAMDRYFMYHNTVVFNARTRPTKYVLTDSWEQEGDAASASLPKFYIQDAGMQSNYYRDNDRRTWKLDYLCLREVKLAYTFPSSLTEQIGLSKVIVYTAGNTLAYFTRDPHAKDINPEWGTTNTYNSQAGYPAVRRINFGLKVTL